MANTQLSEEQIRTRAYYLWEADGRPEGRDWEYWMKAQQEGAPEQRASAKSAKSESATPKRASKRTAVYA